MPQPARGGPPAAGRGQRVIHLHPEAPAKPAAGGACNGCGLCCAAEPCPLGAVLSRQWRGPCRALEWSTSQGRYLCGALAQPARWLPGLPASWARWLVRRWIAAGTACDAELEPINQPACTADPAA